MTDSGCPGRAEELLEDPLVHGSAEPDRRPAPVLRAVPADEPAARGAGPVRASRRSSRASSRSPTSARPARCEFVKYAIGNWECKCGQLKGLEHLRMTCARLRRADHDGAPARGGRSPAPKCGASEQEPGHALRRLRQPGRPADEVLGRRVPGAGHDLLACRSRSPSASSSTTRTRRPGVKHDARRQGGGGLLRRHPADDRARHVRHQRDRARHRLAAPPLARASSSPRSRRTRYLAKIIPYRGSWVEFEYDQKDILFVRIDRKRKFPATIFLRALGLETDEAILRQFYTAGAGAASSAAARHLTVGQGRPRAGGDCATGTPASSARPSRSSPASSSPATTRRRSLEEGLDRALGRRVGASRRPASSPTSSTSTPARCSSRPARSSAPAAVEALEGAGHQGRRGHLPRLGPRRPTSSSTRSARTRTRRKNEAILEIYRRLRPGDPPTYESAKNLFEGMFFDAKQVRLLARRPLQVQHQARRRRRRSTQKTLTPDDFYRVIGYLLRLQQGRRPRRRHRQPRQPPRPRGRRAAREPVPHRPRPHGARDQGEDVRPPGHRLGDAARPDQLASRSSPRSRSSSARRSSRSSWTRRTRSPRSRTSGASRPSGRAASRASAPASRSATSTRRTTAASARSRRRKARTSA